MSAMDLLKNTQASFVQDDKLGVSEPIVYTHRAGLIENIRAFVSKDAALKSEKGTRGNYALFSNVILEEEPQVNDTILYNGVLYKVLPEWKEGSGMYMIYAENNTKHNGRPKRR